MLFASPASCVAAYIAPAPSASRMGRFQKNSTTTAAAERKTCVPAVNHSLGGLGSVSVNQIAVPTASGNSRSRRKSSRVP